MIYPSVGQLIQLNKEMVTKTGGTFGLSDRGLLESAHAAPFAGFGEYELYPGIFNKAAALARSIIQNHPFLDGNKRTGVAAALLVLVLNGYTVFVSNEELVELGVKIAAKEIDIEEIPAWLEVHSRQGWKR